MNGRAVDFDAVAERLQGEAVRLLAALPLLVVAVLVVWFAWAFGRWLSRRRLLDRVARRNPFLRELSRTTVRWLCTGAGLIVALQIMDATALVGAVLGTAGVLGVALGFAFKDTLENYLAGILMSLRQPFVPRDHVVIDGNEGVVMAMTSRATILMTLDGNHLRLPNALVFSSVTLNYSRNPSRRFEFDVGIGVDEDLVAAQAVGIGELGRIDGVMKRPPPRAYIVALGDSSVQVRFHGWVDQRHHDFLLVKSESIRRVKLALERRGMDLPEPIYRVQLARRGDRPTAADPSRAAQPTVVAGADAAETAEAAEIDTRAIHDVLEQIATDPRPIEAHDLLDPQAPKE